MNRISEKKEAPPSPSARRRQALSRSRKYALLGMFLSLGSPLGLFGVRFFSDFQGEFLRWAGAELAGFQELYLYTGAGTMLALSIFGFFLGRSSDLLRAQKNLLEQKAANLRQLSITDGLTHLYTHSYIIRRLEEELSRAVRYAQPLSCLFIDIDDFKSINDRCGHLWGDRVLSEVSGVLAEEVRNTDLIGRYGGDEFVVILPQIGSDTACKVAERIRSRVENAPFGVPDVRCHPTVSIGVYSSPDPAVSPKRFLDMADRAMRHAKEFGKNRTEVIFPEKKAGCSAVL